MQYPRGLFDAKYWYEFNKLPLDKRVPGFLAARLTPR